MGRSWKDFEKNVNKSLKSFKESIHRNLMTLEEAAVWNMFTGKWWERDPCYVVAEVTTLSPTVVQKVENIPDELGDPAKEVSRQR